MSDPERLSASERRAEDEAAYEEQLAYLLERSPFYRAKLAHADTTGGLDEPARLPLTEKAVLTTYDAGPFVAGAALDAFERLGITHIPVGTRSSERLLLAIEQLRPDAVV